MFWNNLLHQNQWLVWVVSVERGRIGILEYFNSARIPDGLCKGVREKSLIKVSSHIFYLSNWKDFSAIYWDEEI